jgi:hypothetical protein
MKPKRKKSQHDSNEKAADLCRGRAGGGSSLPCPYFDDKKGECHLIAQPSTESWSLLQRTRCANVIHTILYRLARKKAHRVFTFHSPDTYYDVAASAFADTYQALESLFSRGKFKPSSPEAVYNNLIFYASAVIHRSVARNGSRELFGGVAQRLAGCHCVHITSDGCSLPTITEPDQKGRLIERSNPYFGARDCVGVNPGRLAEPCPKFVCGVQTESLTISPDDNGGSSHERDVPDKNRSYPGESPPLIEVRSIARYWLAKSGTKGRFLEALRLLKAERYLTDDTLKEEKESIERIGAAVGIDPKTMRADFNSFATWTKKGVGA